MVSGATLEATRTGACVASLEILMAGSALLLMPPREALALANLPAIFAPMHSFHYANGSLHVAREWTSTRSPRPTARPFMSTAKRRFSTITGASPIP